MDEPLHRACPVCGGRESNPFLRKHDLQLVRCSGCSMVYANPAPAEMATGTFYDQAGDEYLSADKLESDYAEVRFQRELRLFRSLCPRGSVLDVGCSSGAFLFQLNRRFPGDYQILDTDVSRAPLEHAAKMGVPVARGHFATLPLAGAFDAVTFWAVMEHLFEPRQFLARAAALLKPGGLCFILVPNLESLAVRLLGVKYRYIFAEHLNYFTPRTLRDFAAREFGLLGLRSTHFNPLVIWGDFRGGARAIPRAERSQLLKRTNAYKKSLLLLPVKPVYRAAEFALGKLMLADNLVIIGQKR